MTARRAYSNAYRCQKGGCNDNGLPRGRIENVILPGGRWQGRYWPARVDASFAICERF
jgi:hypothetical protein